MPAEDRARLRVALATPRAGVHLPRWAGQLLEDLAVSDFATIALIVAGTDEPDSGGLAWRLYDRTIGRVPAGIPDPLAVEDYGRLLDAVPKAAAADDVLRAHDIDVLIPTGSVNEVAAAGTRSGIWRLQPGPDGPHRRSPPYFQEARAGDPVSVISLVAHLPNERQPFLVDRAWLATDRDIYAGRNRVGPYFCGVSMLVENLRRLHAGGLPAMRPQMRLLERDGPIGRKDPGAIELLRWIAPPAAAKIMRRLRRQPPLVQEWRLAMRRGGDVLRDPPNTDMSGFRFVQATPGHFYADPFPVEHEGTCWLFFEDFIYANRKGVLACGQLIGDRLENVRVILERPYHLSFPHVFLHDGRWHLMPESYANGTVDLYVAERFPDVWRFERTLFRGPAVDTALWVEHGRFWFFTTLVDLGGRVMTLRLYSADSLTGDWTPHPANPISRDVRNARGAGAIFRRHGKLYRPSQDCSWRYGYGFALNEIVTLTPERYEERPAIAVSHEWARGVQGTHTYNRASDIEVVDASFYVPRP